MPEKRRVGGGGGDSRAHSLVDGRGGEKARGPQQLRDCRRRALRQRDVLLPRRETLVVGGELARGKPPVASHLRVLGLPDGEPVQSRHAGQQSCLGNP